MPAAKQNFTIEQGATFRKRLTWRGKNNRPVDLTGYTAVMQVRQTQASVEALLELTTVNGRIVLGGKTGTIDLILGADVAAAFTPAFYDLLLTAPDTTKIRFIEGKIDVSLGVTRV